MRRSRPFLCVLAGSLVTAFAAVGHADSAADVRFDERDGAAVVLRVVDEAAEGGAKARAEAVARLRAIPAERRRALLEAFHRSCGDAGSAARAEVIREVLESLGDAELHALLAQDACEDADAPSRLRLLLLLRELHVGHAERLAVAAAATAPDALRRRPLFTSALRATLTTIVARDDAAAARLLASLRGLPPVVLDAVLDVVEPRTGTWELSRALGCDIDVNRALLPRLVRRPLSESEPLCDEAALHVEWCLQSADTGMRRDAALVVGRHHIAQLAPRLVELLEDEDAGVASGARRALSDLTGMRLLPRRDLWQRWLDNELRWLEDHAQATLAEATDENPTVAVAAIRRLTRHRLHRDLVLEGLLPACLHDIPSVRRAACEALGSLGAPAALPYLLGRLEDREPEIVPVASRAIAAITGLPEPDEPSEWEAQLDLTGFHAALLTPR